MLGSALAGALALSSSSQGWVQVTVTRPAPLPPTSALLSGADLAPLVSAAGLLLLAGALAVIAVRGVARIAVGLLVAVAGGALTWSGFAGVSGRLAVDAQDVGGSLGLTEATLHSSVRIGWPMLALVAGVLAIAVGLLVVLRGRRWPGMGRKYERSPDSSAEAPPAAPAARAMSPEDQHSLAWRALDRGEDPTL